MRHGNFVLVNENVGSWKKDFGLSDLNWLYCIILLLMKILESHLLLMSL
jgi:hypothetical protein